jgi:hypothetical protein
MCKAGKKKLTVMKNSSCSDFFSDDEPIRWPIAHVLVSETTGPDCTAGEEGIHVTQTVA